MINANQEFTKEEIQVILEFFEDLPTINILNMWQSKDLINGFEKFKKSITPKPIEIKKSADDYFSSF